MSEEPEETTVEAVQKRLASKDMEYCEPEAIRDLLAIISGVADKPTPAVGVSEKPKVMFVDKACACAAARDHDKLVSFFLSDMQHEMGVEGSKSAAEEAIRLLRRYYKPTPAPDGVISDERIDAIYEMCREGQRPLRFRVDIRQLIALATQRQRERSAKFMRCFHDDSTLEQHMICDDCRDAILGGGDE